VLHEIPPAALGPRAGVSCLVEVRFSSGDVEIAVGVKKTARARVTDALLGVGLQRSRSMYGAGGIVWGRSEEHERGGGESTRVSMRTTFYDGSR